MQLPTRRPAAYLSPRARKALSAVQVLVLILSLVVPAFPAAAMPAYQEETPPAAEATPPEIPALQEGPPAEVILDGEAGMQLEAPPIEAIPAVVDAPAAIDDCEIDSDGANVPRVVMVRRI